MGIFPNTYWVEVRNSTYLKFPNLCVVCGNECKHRRFISGHSSFIGLLKSIIGAEKQIEVPCHQKCANKINLQLFIRNFLFVLFGIISLIFVLYFEYSKIVLFGILALVWAPFIFFHMFNPFSVTFWCEKESYSFVFKNRSYAGEFASLNKSKIEDRFG